MTVFSLATEETNYMYTYMSKCVDLVMVYVHVHEMETLEATSL